MRKLLFNLWCVFFKKKTSGIMISGTIPVPILLKRGEGRK